MTTVRISPGTRPSKEYDHGNDMMARQMYSENSKAAVWRGRISTATADARDWQGLGRITGKGLQDIL